jgi:hypothetical protein
MHHGSTRLPAGRTSLPSVSVLHVSTPGLVLYMVMMRSSCDVESNGQTSHRSTVMSPRDCLGLSVLTRKATACKRHTGGVACVVGNVSRVLQPQQQQAACCWHCRCCFLEDGQYHKDECHRDMMINKVTYLVEPMGPSVRQGRPASMPPCMLQVPCR